MPEISVLLCVYNGEAFLTECLEGILNQTFKDFEFIIVNDGSTDRSLEILTTYMRNDPRMILINRKENTGIAASVTEGIKHCRGKYIARIDQDDISQPDHLLKRYQYLEAHPEIDVVGSSLYYIDKNGNPTGDNLIRPTDPMVIRLQMYYRCVVHNPSVLMRAGFYRQYNMDSEEKELIASDDYSFWLRENTRHLYANLENNYLLYRVHKHQTSVEYSRTQMDETLQAVQMAYWELLGRSVPVNVIEPFYYINRVTISDPKIVKQGLMTIFQIQKAFEKMNRLTAAQLKETRRFSYEKLKSYMVKYRAMPGILAFGILCMIRLSPFFTVEDALHKLIKYEQTKHSSTDEE